MSKKKQVRLRLTKVTGPHPTFVETLKLVQIYLIGVYLNNGYKKYERVKII